MRCWLHVIPIACGFAKSRGPSLSPLRVQIPHGLENMMSQAVLEAPETDQHDLVAQLMSEQHPDFLLEAQVERLFGDDQGVRD